MSVGRYSTRVGGGGFKSSCEQRPPPPACASPRACDELEFLGLEFLGRLPDLAKRNLTPSLPAVIPVIILFLIFTQPGRLNKDMLRRHFGRTRHTLEWVSVGGLFSVRGTGQHKQEKVFAVPVRPVATQTPRRSAVQCAHTSHDMHMLHATCSCAHFGAFVLSLSRARARTHTHTLCGQGLVRGEGQGKLLDERAGC